MQRYNESLAQTPGPVLPKDLPRITIDYRSLFSYAKQKGIEPSELSEGEKEQFIIKRSSQEQSA